MRGVLRQGDYVQSTCPRTPSGPILTASHSTFCNNRGVARLSDHTVPGPILSGSNTHFCDGRPIARLGDRIHCGVALTCSMDTFID